jgi:hypothetical protein
VGQVAKMSKLSFRARALDATKPLPIYLAEEIPDSADCSLINRAVPQMPTGMEKEEEAVRFSFSSIFQTFSQLFVAILSQMVMISWAPFPIHVPQSIPAYDWLTAGTRPVLLIFFIIFRALLWKLFMENYFFFALPFVMVFYRFTIALLE